MSKEDIKRIQVYKYSNPNVVFDKAVELFGEDGWDLDISTRKDKKYMIKGYFTDDKWVHFGQMGYNDFTKTNDEDKRAKFLTRNKSWEHRNINTPAFLSYHLLW